MIDEDIRHIIEREMSVDEKLVWADRALGGLLNRYGLAVLIFHTVLATWIFYYLKDRNGSDNLLIFVLFFSALFYILKFLRITFSPRFETYGLTKDHLYIVRFLLFRSVRKFPITIKTHAHEANWSGPNDVIVHWKETQKGFMRFSFDLKVVVLHGLSEPQLFIDTLDEMATSG